MDELSEVDAEIYRIAHILPPYNKSLNAGPIHFEDRKAFYLHLVGERDVSLVCRDYIKALYYVFDLYSNDIWYKSNSFVYRHKRAPLITDIV